MRQAGWGMYFIVIGVVVGINALLIFLVLDLALFYVGHGWLCE